MKLIFSLIQVMLLFLFIIIEGKRVKQNVSLWDKERLIEMVKVSVCQSLNMCAIPLHYCNY